MALKDLALAADGDLLINETGDFEIIDAVRQGVQIRLRWIKGEWVFNTAMGTPYFETILVKVPNRALIEKALRDQILAVDGVIGVGTINLTSSGGLDDDYAARIKSLLMEENLSAGTTIRLQKFIRPIMENVSGVDYIEIRGLLSEKPEIETVVDSSMLTGIVPVQINQQPIISMSGIRVVKA